MSTIRVLDPATGLPVGEYATHSPAEVLAALDQASRAQHAWQEATAEERAQRLRATAGLLRERKATYADLITAEMGKPLAEALAEVEKCAVGCDYYADAGPGLLMDERVEVGTGDARVVYEPLGVVLAIMPWNFPFWQVMRCAAPVLMAGNGCVLKHSPNTTGCALAVEQLLRDAGFPVGLFRAIVVAEPDVPDTVARLIADPRVAAVTLTGSERAGAAVAAEAGRALKKAVLELGGSDPFVVLDDADPVRVVESAVTARFANAGQSCIAAKRFIVAEPVAEEFEERFAAAVAALTVGPPRDAATRIGPMARPDLVDALERQVRASVEQGAAVLTGAERLPGPGSWFAPTVLARVTVDMPVFAQETFGPVAAVVRAGDDDEALRLAESTTFGLGASIWTADVERGLRLGRRIRSGALFVNGVVASDPRLPFGGTKRSGFGRELGAAGLREFTNVRTVWTRPA